MKCNNDLFNWFSGFKDNIKEYPLFSFCLITMATGSTPLGMYRKLIEFHKQGRISFRYVKTFNMDEYVNLPREHPESYHYFMWNNFFKHIDILPENVHILDGNAADLQTECLAYEEKIKEAGGVHLFVGGNHLLNRCPINFKNNNSLPSPSLPENL